MKSRNPFSPRPASLAAALALLAGCGGGGGGGGGVAPIADATGRLSVHIAWPTEATPGRVVPANAQSIKIELLKSGTPFRTLLLVKPQAQADFTELPLGAISVRATAFPTLTGTGTALATTTTAATVTADAPVTVPLTMASTVASVAFSAATLNLAASASAPVTVSAKNAEGNAVLLAPEALSYVSSAPALVKVTKNADGSATLAHLAGVGSATITVTEAASGKKATLLVTVVPKISVSPATTVLSVSGTATFAATVLGPTNASVTWSVQESNGGTVTSAGFYTAPATKGTYHVVATSVADPTLKATATVTVRSGSGSVIVN